MSPSPPLRYAVVTPARNERDNIERLAAALAAQDHAPTWWVIADDGSTDGTRELGLELAASDPRIRVETRTAATGGLSDGRRQARDLLAFQHGIRRLPEPVDVVVKVDADVSVEADFFARLLDWFAREPGLAIAGGACTEWQDGAWVRRKIVPSAVWGATRAYRAEVLDVALALAPNVGWDGIDEIQVQLRGWKTGTDITLPFRHHRPEGLREGKLVRAHILSGEAAWYMGYRPSYLVLRSLYRARADRAALGLMWGYGAGALRRAPRCPDADVIRVLRRRQRLSVAFRGGTPE